MTDAFICDAVRTPFGRYGGALATCAHRRPRRDPDHGADGAQPRRSTGRAVDDVVYGCANQARRGQPQRRRAWRSLLAGLPVDVPGCDDQSPVRLEHGRDRASPRARSRAARPR